MAPKPLTDESLLRRVARGDLSAFEHLFLRYEGAVLGYFLRALRRRELAKDLTAETFLSLYTSLRHYSAERPFRPYLFGIARRCLTRFLRRNRDPLQKIPPPTPVTGSSVDSQSREDPLLAAKRFDRGSEVRAAVRALPEPYRESVSLCYFDGLRPVEVAELLGIPPATVRSRLARGLALLHSTLRHLL